MPVIRNAKAEDLPRYLEMVQGLLESNQSYGAHLVPDDANLRFYRSLFESYIQGSLFGAVLVWFPDVVSSAQGFCLAGEGWNTSDLSLDCGKMAQLWGVYVEPDHRRTRAAIDLMRKLVTQLSPLGFGLMTTDAMVSNDPAHSLGDMLGMDRYTVVRTLKL